MKVVLSSDLGEPWAHAHLVPPTHSAPASSRTKNWGDSWLPAPPRPAPRHALPLGFPPLQMFGGRVFLQAQVSRCAAEGPVITGPEKHAGPGAGAGAEAAAVAQKARGSP